MTRRPPLPGSTAARQRAGRSDPGRHPTRRTALVTAGAAGLALGVAGRAGASSPAALPGVTAPVAETSGGELTKTFSAVAFRPDLPSTTWQVGNGLFIVSTAGPASFYLPIDLPVGSRVVRLTGWFSRTDTASAPNIALLRNDLNSPAPFPILAVEGAVPTGDTQSVTSTGDYVIGATECLVASATLPGGDAYRLVGVQVGYLPPGRSFTPITPARVYDSRSAQPQPGRLSGSSGPRVVSVADGRSARTGAVVSPDVVPVGATAVAYNLTVTGTTGPGHLGVAPGTARTTPTSAINWTSARVTLANASTVALDADREIVLIPAGASAHVVVDVVGFYA